MESLHCAPQLHLGNLTSASMSRVVALRYFSYLLHTTSDLYYTIPIQVPLEGLSGLDCRSQGEDVGKVVVINTETAQYEVKH